MYDVVTIGGAVRDFTFYLEPLKEKNYKFICFLTGTKINVKETYFTHGGGACNVAVGLSNFGLKVAVITRVGQDYSGQAIIDGLKKKNVETRFIQIDRKLHTGVSVIIQPKEGERTILSYRGANDNLELTDNDLKIKTNWIYISSLSGNWKNILNKIYSRFKKVKIAWNPGISQLQTGKSKLIKFLKKTEVLILNRNEASILTGKSEKNIPFLLKSIFELGPKIVIITCGKEGAFLINKERIIYQSAHPIKKVDTTGAGDSFSSGFLAGLILFNDIKKAFKLGILNSAYNLTKIGAQEGLLTKKDLKRLNL